MIVPNGMVETLNLIASGTTVRGDRFFSACVHTLAQLLRAQYVYIAEYSDPVQNRARTLAFWNGSALGENFEFGLAGKPCALVMQGNCCRIPHDLQTQFPQDLELVALEADSYLGLPITDTTGTVIGSLTALDPHPLPDDADQQIAICQIFAARAGAEIAQLRAREGFSVSESQHGNLERQQRERVLEQQIQREHLVSQITQGKEKQRRKVIETAQSAAEAANQIKSQFLAHMSHELRTPLNTIMGFSELLQQDKSLNDHQRKMLHSIHNNGRQLLQLINQILELSKGESQHNSLDIIQAPLQPVTPPSDDQPPRIIDAQTTAHHRLLVADDRAENRQMLVEILEGLGFSVRAVTNGKEAIACWQDWQPHLIWMDMKMPVLDGGSAAQHIKHQAQHQPPIIIALTGYTSAQERAHALAHGCDDFLSKPYRTIEVWQKLSQHLGLESAPPHNIAPRAVDRHDS